SVDSRQLCTVGELERGYPSRIGPQTRRKGYTHMIESTSDLSTAGLTRRGLLRGVLMTAGATLLAACSTPTQPVSNAPQAPTNQPAAAPTTAAAAPVAPTQPQPAQQAPATSSGPVEITFLDTQTNDADVKIYQQLADKFHQENPNITVKTSATDGTNYDQKLLTYVQAGTLPDIVRTSDNFAKPFKDAGITQ